MWQPSQRQTALENTNNATRWRGLPTIKLFTILMSTKQTEKDRITIRSVEIEIGGTKLKLTLEQVAELKKILAKAFPEPETKTVYVPGPERVVERFRPLPPMQWFKSPDTHKYDEWRVTCQAQAGVLKLAAGHAGL